MSLLLQGIGRPSGSVGDARHGGLSGPVAAGSRLACRRPGTHPFRVQALARRCADSGAGLRLHHAHAGTIMGTTPASSCMLTDGCRLRTMAANRCVVRATSPWMVVIALSRSGRLRPVRPGTGEGQMTPARWWMIVLAPASAGCRESLWQGFPLVGLGASSPRAHRYGPASSIGHGRRCCRDLGIVLTAACDGGAVGPRSSLVTAPSSSVAHYVDVSTNMAVSGIGIARRRS